MATVSTTGAEPSAMYCQATMAKEASAAAPRMEPTSKSSAWRSLSFLFDEGERRRQDGRKSKQDPSRFAAGEYRNDPASAEMAAPNPNRMSRSPTGKSPNAPRWMPTTGWWPR